MLKYSDLIKKILDELGFKCTSKNSKEFRGKCLLHNDTKPSFSIDRRTGKWTCFSGCGSGNLVRLVAKRNKISYKKAEEYIYGNNTLDTILYKINQHVAENEDDNRSIKDESLDKVPLPKEIIELDTADKCPEYLLRRINFDTIKRFKLKKVMSGNLKNRIIVPIFENKEVMGFIARDFTSKSSKKVLYPSGWKVSKYIFNIDNIDSSKRVIIVEGIFDVMKLVELGFTNTVGIFGINFNMQRITKLIEKGVTKIAICLDNDKETKAGQMASESVAKRVKYLFYTKVVNLPEGKDPDECSVDQLNQAFLESKDV